MSEWKEINGELSEKSYENQDSSAEQDESTNDELNLLREKQDKELAEDMQKMEKERKLRQSPKMISAMQGYSETEEDSIESGQDVFDGKGDNNSGIDQASGVAPLSLETKMKLNEIKNLPVKDRQKAMGDFFNSHRNLLGNQTSEGNNLQLDARIHPGGKGVTIIDADGTKYEIIYEE